MAHSSWDTLYTYKRASEGHIDLYINGLKTTKLSGAATKRRDSQLLRNGIEPVMYQEVKLFVFVCEARVAISHVRSYTWF